MIIDAHQHFWDPTRADYYWMTGAALPLKRIYAPADLRPEMQRAGVSATVLVQTRSSLDETHEFLATAEREDFCVGVVGWVDLTDARVAQTLSDLQRGPHGRWLVGIRHQVHDEADADWLLRPDVQRGLAAVQSAGLTYDLLLRTRELPAAVKTVAAFPGLRFVVDHIAKPEIAQHVMEPWATLMSGFAPHRGHVWCKLSGMVTEASFTDWSAADLAPYIRHVLGVFGASRCLYGSDWPVCTLASSYPRVLEALRTNLAGLSVADLDQVLRASAIEVYRLDTQALAALAALKRSGT
jgi:L-fuconolactonase